MAERAEEQEEGRTRRSRNQFPPQPSFYHSSSGEVSAEKHWMTDDGVVYLKKEEEEN